MSTCQERVISRPQEDSMAPCGLFQLCDSDSEVKSSLRVAKKFLKHDFQTSG